MPPEPASTISWPRISIVTPSYNQASYLEATLCSILDQDYPNFEYLVLDGGSTDGSVEILRKYAGRLAYWEAQPDRGQSHALNKGFARSTGEIIGYLNSDDLYLPGTLSTVGRFFVEHPEIDVVYGDQVDIDENGTIFRATRSLPFSRLGLLSRAGAIPQPASFWRRSVYDRLGGFREDLHWSMDYEFFLRAAARGCRITYISTPLAKFRYHASSKTVIGKTSTDGREIEMRQLQDAYRGRCPWAVIRLTRVALRVARVLANLDGYLRFFGYYRRRLLSYATPGAVARF